MIVEYKIDNIFVNHSYFSDNYLSSEIPKCDSPTCEVVFFPLLYRTF